MTVASVVGLAVTGVGLPTMSGSVPFQAQEITVQRNAGARRRDRGSATLELAIVLPVLVSVVFGIIDFARLFNAEIQVSQAAREGVRLASLVTTTNTPAYTAADVTDRVQAGGTRPRVRERDAGHGGLRPSCAPTRRPPRRWRWSG